MFIVVELGLDCVYRASVREPQNKASLCVSSLEMPPDVCSYPIFDIYIIEYSKVEPDACL
jgi:hypothetical protein